MIQRNRINALTRTSLAVIIGVALEACGAGTHPAPTAQSSSPATPQSDSAVSGPVLPEVVVSAPRLNSRRVAEETSSRPLAKRGG